MSLVCPVSENYIDNNTARLSAFFTLLLLLIFILTPLKWVIILIGMDFLLRRVYKGRFSYLSRLSKLTSGILGLMKIKINAGPKLFAANVGLLITGLTVMFYYTGLHSVSYVLAGSLVFFTALESLFNVCVACVLYPIFSEYLA